MSVPTQKHPAAFSNIEKPASPSVARSPGPGSPGGAAVPSHPYPLWMKRSERDQIELFIRLDVYHMSPDSGERQYKSRILNGDLIPL